VRHAGGLLLGNFAPWFSSSLDAALHGTAHRQCRLNVRAARKRPLAKKIADTEGVSFFAFSNLG
jgi:hypothetical protein